MPDLTWDNDSGDSDSDGDGLVAPSSDIDPVSLHHAADFPADDVGVNETDVVPIAQAIDVAAVNDVPVDADETDLVRQPIEPASPMRYQLDEADAIADTSGIANEIRG